MFKHVLYIVYFITKECKLLRSCQTQSYSILVPFCDRGGKKEVIFLFLQVVILFLTANLPGDLVH